MRALKAIAWVLLVSLLSWPLLIPFRFFQTLTIVNGEASAFLVTVLGRPDDAASGRMHVMTPWSARHHLPIWTYRRIQCAPGQSLDLNFETEDSSVAAIVVEGIGTSFIVPVDSSTTTVVVDQTVIKSPVPSDVSGLLLPRFLTARQVFLLLVAVAWVGVAALAAVRVFNGIRVLYRWR